MDHSVDNVALTIVYLLNDIEAYRGALGYSVRGTHNGRLTDGSVPHNGLADAKDKDIANLRELLTAAYGMIGVHRDAIPVDSLLARIRANIQ